MIKQALNKMSVFENFPFWLLTLGRPLFLKTECFQKTFVCTNFPFWQILVCTQAQNGKDGRIFKQEHVSVNVLKGSCTI